MAENSKIEWCDHTANFWWGCMKVSEGCANCYAETWANRWGKNIWGPSSTTKREYKKAAWSDVPKWDRQAANTKQRTRVFVQSMSDFFEDHPQVDGWRQGALNLMSDCANLDFLVLTKRPENISKMIEKSTGHDIDAWTGANQHVWFGTTVENQEQADKRIPELLRIPSRIRFLSCEPLLGPIDLGFPFVSENPYMTIAHVDWVIVGGESGPNARPMHPDWARSIRDQCRQAHVSFFFKQWGEWHPNCLCNNKLPCKTMNRPYGKPGVMFHCGKHAGRLLDDSEYSGFPVS